MKKKKILNLFIGSNNRGKIKEIRALLPKTVRILTPKHLSLNSPKETGKTFQENSFLKAKFFSKKTKMICLADDSGLEIDSLNKLPGIYSARWGGKKSNFNLAIKKVYKELKKNNLTKQDLFDKGEEDEKIQNKISRNGDRGSSNNSIRQRTNNRKSRK